MRVFVIRPFGIKNDIDFDAVDSDLIQPALANQHLEIAGDTTTEIVRAGNIRADMFEMILTAELVIADISLHNVNVYYELGIRHAVRAQKTILIRSRVAGAEVPFDLKTDRYLLYDNQRPGDAVSDLSETIKQTLASNEKDSPVFTQLPNLRPIDPSRLALTPVSFSEDLSLARDADDRGKLGLFLEETKGMTWRVGALRSIGQAAFELKDYELAKEAFEDLRELYEADVQSNTVLGTVYQRLGELKESSNALERVLNSADVERAEFAEAGSLLARNSKARWEKEWRAKSSVKARQKAALESAHLDICLNQYMDAYSRDRNHFFSGINALAISIIKRALMQQLPKVSAQLVGGDEESLTQLKELDNTIGELTGSVKLSIESALPTCKRFKNPDKTWAEISLADHAFLTVDSIPQISKMYKSAMSEAEPFHQTSAHQQIALYQSLGLFTKKCNKIIKIFESDEGEKSNKPHVLLFTGHRMDNLDRANERFPATLETVARKQIKKALKSEIKKSKAEHVIGISGAASGGDILFHEVCAELGIESEVYLAFPEKEYIVASVADAGGNWVERFQAIVDEKSKSDSLKILSNDKHNPDWLATKQAYGVWQRTNLWMLYSAFSLDDKASLVALWDLKPGDDVGGTQDMVERAQERGAQVNIIDINKLRDAK